MAFLWPVLVTGSDFLPYFLQFWMALAKGWIHDLTFLRLPDREALHLISLVFGSATDDLCYVEVIGMLLNCFASVKWVLASFCRYILHSFFGTIDQENLIYSLTEMTSGLEKALGSPGTSICKCS